MKLSERGAEAQNAGEAISPALWLEVTHRTPAASDWFSLRLRYVDEEEYHASLLNLFPWYCFYEIVWSDFLLRDFLQPFDRWYSTADGLLWVEDLRGHDCGRGAWKVSSACGTTPRYYQTRGLRVESATLCSLQIGQICVTCGL